MDYTNFQEMIKAEIQNIYPNAVIKIDEVPKWNGDIFTGLTICEKVNVSPTVYLESFFSDFLNGFGIDEIVTNICRIYESHRLSDDIDLSFLMDFEQVKPYLRMRIINTEKNRELLQTIPHIPFLDLSIVFYIDIDSDEMKQSSITVTNNLLEIWEENSENIKNIAFNNIKNCDYYSFDDITGVIRGLIEKTSDKNDWMDDISELESLLEHENVNFQPMYVITNQSKLFGAVAIYDLELLSKIGHTFKKDYYILPSSTHEILLLPKSTNTDPGELRKTVQDINRDVVDPQEFLSDNIYFYQWETNSLSVVET